MTTEAAMLSPSTSNEENQAPSNSNNANNALTSHEIKNAQFVYVLDPQQSWIPAQVVERPTPDEVVLKIPQYANEQAIQCDGGRTAKRFRKEQVSSDTNLLLQNVDPEGRLQMVEDMVDLPFLHEAAILYNLKARHVRSLPYTLTGDIVLACNPYRWIHDLYSYQTRRLYSQALVWDRHNHLNRKGADDPRSHLPPHVYEASSLAYKGLLEQGEDQSILVSGESGAGKTETVKILLGDLASVQQGLAAVGQAANNAIVQKVLDSNPLLEAFGNAQTLRNDNSSRFGKYLQLQFHRVSPSVCRLAGSKCEVYLLEKSRVTLHEAQERTYHVLYQLLAAPEATKAEIWPYLANTDAESFCYVGWSATNVIEGKSDSERFQMTVEALELMGVTGSTLRMLWRAICVVLQLGNLEFQAISDDACAIASQDELKELATLMGLELDVLTTALTIRNVEARSEIFAVPMTAMKAKESADAFAKEIYAKTFLWHVRTINDATCAEKNYPTQPPEYGTIGLLDIFGFETFEVNRFEQLCINYANEKLQQKFTQDIFRSVQVEYEMEGIELQEITYNDNTDVLDLVEGRMGLLAFLNEECVRPKGSDKTFVYKANAMNKDNLCFFRKLHAADTEFGIVHYAGRVTYDATEFVTKNNDTLPTDLQDVATLSSNEIISMHLNNEAMMNPRNEAPLSVRSGGTSGIAPKKRRPRASMANAQSQKMLKKRSSNIIAETVWTKFKNQLCRLMETLSETQTRYIRCIKPNTQKSPLLMEHASTVEQLRCAGVVAAVTISRSAFPNRLEHLVVLERFKSLWPKGDHNTILKDMTLDAEERTHKAVDVLLTIALKDMEFERQNVKFRAFVMGKTRAYFREGALEFLEAERMKYLGKYATTVQSQVRGYVCRRKYQRHKYATIQLQAGYRRRCEQSAYQKLRTSSVRVQCWYRVLFAARTIVHLRRMFKATLIQTQWRIRRDQGRYCKMRAATIVIQTVMRGAYQRPRYRQALIDKKEEAKLENQLRSLQRKLEEAEAKRIDAEKEAEERAKVAVELYKKQEEEEKESKDTEGKQLKDEGFRDAEEPTDEERKGHDDLRSMDPEEFQHITEEQQKLMDESGRMLEYLRKEVFKLRSQNQQLKTDFDLLKDNNQRLMDANASAGASFAALNQHAKQLSKQNTSLLTDVSSLKAQNQKLNILQIELKDELKMKQASYVGEVRSRLQYQKALQQVTEMVSERCRDHRLVEKVLKVVDECEMDYIASDGQPGEQQFDNGDESNEPRGIESKSSIFRYLNPFG